MQQILLQNATVISLQNATVIKNPTTLLATVTTKCIWTSVKDVNLCISLYLSNHKDIHFVKNVIQSISWDIVDGIKVFN